MNESNKADWFGSPEGAWNAYEAAVNDSMARTTDGTPERDSRACNKCGARFRAAASSLQGECRACVRALKALRLRYAQHPLPCPRCNTLTALNEYHVEACGNCGWLSPEG